MPTGQFYGSPDSYERQGSITGSGPASQPKSPLASSYPYPSLDSAVATARSGGGGAPSTGSSPWNPGTGQYGAFGEVRIGGQESPNVGLYGLPGQNPNTEPSPFNQMAGVNSLVSAMYGPQTALLDQQLARQYDQMGMIGANTQYQTDALRRDNALANRALGLDRQALGVDRGLTNTQLANLDRLRAILRQQYGLAGDVLANQMAGFDIDAAKARDMAKRGQWDLRSDLTQRGAFNTVANERGTGRINRDLQYQLGQIGVGREGARLQNRGSVLGLDEKGIGYDNQVAGLNARLAGIGIDTARLGIKSEQLANQLQDGLHQIGLSGMVSINGLLDAIGGTNTQQAQLANTILTEVMGYANLPPDVLKQLQTALGVAPGQQVASRDATVTGSRMPL